MASQPDVLDAHVYIARNEQGFGDFFAEVIRQVEAETGYRISADGSALGIGEGRPQVYGADNVAAREVLADIAGETKPPSACDLDYDPGSRKFFLSLIRIAPPEPPHPPAPPPLPQPPPQMRSVPPAVWNLRSRTPIGTLQIQTALSRAGYLRTAPTGRWDANAADAIRRLQAANGAPTTGTLDAATSLRLEPFLPKLTPERRPYVPMSHELAYWLATTRAGQQEIQEALVKAGFYTGPANGCARPRHETG